MLVKLLIESNNPLKSDVLVLVTRMKHLIVVHQSAYCLNIAACEIYEGSSD
jgi:hypothetical protein